MTAAGLSGHLRDHPPRFVAPYVRRVESSLTPTRTTAHVTALDATEVEHNLGCECGHAEFRLLGVPTSMIDARRGYTLRSVLRLWRELQAGAARDEGDAKRPLSPPVVLDCSHCRARIELVPAPDADPGTAKGAKAPEPLEAHRCRPCRRSSFDVSVVFRHPALLGAACDPQLTSHVSADCEPQVTSHVGADCEAQVTSHVGAEERFEGWRLIVRCRSCGAVGEPYAFRLRTEQQRRIDHLYGRDDPGQRVDAEEEP